MRPLKRNAVPFWYSLYEGTEPLLDENGFRTGEDVVKYSEPERARGNLSASKGEAIVEVFGTSEDYDAALLPLDQTLALSETSLLWLDGPPAAIDTPHDHVVKRVARSLNVVIYAIKRVRSGG